MNGIARKVTPAEEVNVIREDPADNRILECAAAARSDYIVSGDNDLLRVKTFRDMPIVKVANFLELAAKGRVR
jgi:predicted nucleic acid-binding protein